MAGSVSKLSIARFGLWFEFFTFYLFYWAAVFALPVRSVIRKDEVVATMKASVNRKLFLSEIVSIINYFRNRL